MTTENGQWEKEKMFNFERFSEKNGKLCLFSIFNYFERLAQKIQLWHMRKNHTIETVTDKTIRFHPRDISQEVLVKYAEQTKDLKIINS